MIPFTKYHGTGNDFLVVDADDAPADHARFAETFCDRAEGVGADGVLFLDLDRGGDPPRVGMRLVQPDGSEAAMCGNGARCAARFAAERLETSEIVLETPAGDRPAAIDGDVVTVDVGVPTFDPAAVPVDAEEPLIDEELGGYRVTAVNTGVPHVVAFVDDVESVPIEDAGPALRHDEAFPDGANATFASPAGDGGFDQRTYERGVEGETASCGTGAVAVAAVARRRGEAGDEVTVRPPGGSLRIAFDDGGAAQLTGPTAREFEGEASP